MASLATRGGTTIKNRILSAGGGEEGDTCPFSVMAYETENPGTYKAFIEDGEINYTRFYEKNGGGMAAAEVIIDPDCELALMVIFMSNDYEYKKIQEIYIATNFDASKKEEFATQVVDYGDGSSQITMYIPLAYIFFDTSTSPSTLTVRQYFCGNIDFRMYHTTINGEACFEFFKTIGLTPGKIPKTTPDE
jgi:hypothetical protein